jgi:hypothetical protein
LGVPDRQRLSARRAPSIAAATSAMPKSCGGP